MKSTIFRSSPCFLKMPSWSPTLTGMIGSAFGAALPTVSVADPAGAIPAAANTKANAASKRPRAGFPTMASSARWSGASVAMRATVWTVLQSADVFSDLFSASAEF